MNLFSKKNIKQGYEDSKMKIDLEESDTKMYIVLDKDSKTCCLPLLYMLVWIDEPNYKKAPWLCPHYFQSLLQEKN